MNNVFNKDVQKWIRPWNQEKFDDLYNRDERFFAIVFKGLISWLNRNIVMYDKQINHFIFNTGSSYLYMESNGYEYNLVETTGEDAIYMQLPRCIMELTNIHIATEELTSPFARGNYERRDGDLIRGYNAEIRRLPLEVNVRLVYYLGTFNETIILMQELIDKLVFQKYFNITYLGNIIQCSIEFPTETSAQLNKIDMSSPEQNQKTIELALIVNTSYPIINERSAIQTDKVIVTYGVQTDLLSNDEVSDVVKKGKVLDTNLDGYHNFIESLENINNGTESILDIEDIETLIEKYDINDDHILDETEINSILEQIKYDSYIEGDTNKDYVLDYNDLAKILTIMNQQDNISIDYDKITNKIYVVHEDTGDVKEIDLTKYKIE